MIFYPSIIAFQKDIAASTSGSLKVRNDPIQWFVLNRPGANSILYLVSVVYCDTLAILQWSLLVDLETVVTFWRHSTTSLIYLWIFVFIYLGEWDADMKYEYPEAQKQVQISLYTIRWNSFTLLLQSYAVVPETC